MMIFPATPALGILTDPPKLFGVVYGVKFIRPHDILLSHLAIVINSSLLSDSPASAGPIIEGVGVA